MKKFNISTMQYSTVLYLHSERHYYQLDPEYQRESDIWPLEKRQLLIDSIINGYDIPKFYFHKFSKPKRIDSRTYTHAIVDGKQRLTSIWEYIDGRFPLSDDIEFVENGGVDLRGLTYAELGKSYPHLKTRFDSYPLSAFEVNTDDIDLIEDMFSRLNEAVPLSAAEKRNAFGGPMPRVIRELSRTEFCSGTLPFGNKRYRHYDLIAKFLHIEESGKIVDTKKIYLDEFVKSWKAKPSRSAKAVGRRVADVLSAMEHVFTKSDSLLRSVGMVVLYYYVFRIALSEGWVEDASRSKFIGFENTRNRNRKAAESNIKKAQYDLLEFDRYIQTPNDGYATAVRLRILLSHVFDKKLPIEYQL